MDSLSSHDSVAAVADDVAAATARPTSRRRLFGAGLGGVVAALSQALAGRAAASPDDTTDDSTDDTAAPTSGAPSGDHSESTLTKRPTAGDLELLRFATGAELAARDLYDAALASETLADDEIGLYTAIREAHEAYAQALSGVIGRTAPDVADEALVDDQTAAFTSSSASAIAAAGASLESTLAATHRSLLGQVVSTDAARLLASIVTVEGRHAVVLSTKAGDDSLDDTVVNSADPLTSEN